MSPRLLWAARDHSVLGVASGAMAIAVFLSVMVAVGVRWRSRRWEPPRPYAEVVQGCGYGEAVRTPRWAAPVEPAPPDPCHPLLNRDVFGPWRLADFRHPREDRAPDFCDAPELDWLSRPRAPGSRRRP